MKIGIWNLEPNYRNFALDKVKLYYQRKGDEIEYNMFIGQYDLVYCSAIFDWTPISPKYKGLPYHLIQTGGTGFNLTTILPLEIEAIEPHYNYGFTTRGCIRKCKFCVVPQKEGYIHIVNDLLSLWDGKSGEIILYDNNILALPEHFAFVCEQARANNVKLDFNQGLDHRLLTPELVDIMKSIKHFEYRFAFDSPTMFSSVERAIDLLQSKGINRCSWYVLVGFNTTFQQDLIRLNYLRERNQIAFVQRYQKKGVKLGREYIALARWVNQHHIYRGMTWEQFCKHASNKRYSYLIDSNLNCDKSNLEGGV